MPEQDFREFIEIIRRRTKIFLVASIAIIIAVLLITFGGGWAFIQAHGVR